MPERHQYHGQPNGRVVATREPRGTPVPGTPSRKDKPRESLAVQDPGLKDYVGSRHTTICKCFQVEVQC